MQEICASASRRAWCAAVGLVLATSFVHAQDRPPQAGDTAARVNGVTILAGEVDAKIGYNLASLQEEIYALRQKQLEALIDQALLRSEAARRGLTLDALVETEITSKVTPATADDAAKFFAANKARIQGDLASRREQIQSLLTAQRLEDRQHEFVATLRASAKIETFLTPPPVFRATISTAGAPVRGVATAPVTIIEFSDFHCPYCKAVQPALGQVLAKYGDKVKLVFRDYPVDVLHPQARAASEAARCATDQGKFWEFHDAMFAIGADATPATLDRLARNAGLDLAAFTACRTSGKYKAAVQASNDEGAALGVSGTPTFFINGRILVGAQPVDAFSKIIDEELAAAGAARPGGR